MRAISSRDLRILCSCRTLRMYMREGSERGYFSGRTILATTLSLRIRRVAFLRFSEARRLPLPLPFPSSASPTVVPAPAAAAATTFSTTASMAA
jgi:hypothetical protein